MVKHGASGKPRPTKSSSITAKIFYAGALTETQMIDKMIYIGYNKIKNFNENKQIK